VALKNLSAAKESSASGCAGSLLVLASFAAAD